LNSRLDEVQAAILRVKLKRLDKMIKKRNNIARIYLKNLRDTKQITLPKKRKDALHAYHLFVIQSERRDALMEFLRANDVQTLIHYPIPIHKQKCYPRFNNLSLKKTEQFANSILSLPIHPFMKKEEALIVCNLIKEFCEKQ